jgi:hypothetical protein
MALPPAAQRRANLRTGWLLAGLAALFAAGFVVRVVLGY